MDGKIATHEYYQQIIDEHDPNKKDDIVGKMYRECEMNLMDVVTNIYLYYIYNDKDDPLQPRIDHWLHYY